MPFLSVFRAAAQVGLGVDHAVFEEEEAVGREAGSQRDVEASVAIEIDGILAVALKAFLVGEEHGDFCAVSRGIEHLFCDVFAQVHAVDLGLEDEFAFAGCHVIGILCGGSCE